MTIQAKIDGTAEAWESGELGRDEEHVAVANDVDQEKVDDSLELQMISIRLQKSLIEDLKMIAKYNGLGYQPLIKRFLTRFAESEKRLIMRKLIKEQQMQQELSERQRTTG